MKAQSYYHLNLVRGAKSFSGLCMIYGFNSCFVSTPLKRVNETVSHVIHVQDPLTITRMFEINTADYQLMRSVAVKMISLLLPPSASYFCIASLWP